MTYKNFGGFFRTGMAGCVACLVLVHAAQAQPAPFAPLADVVKLGDGELSGLRGGYQLAPGVTAYFAFSQTIMLNGNVLQTIVVPRMEISGANAAGTIIIGGGSGNTVVTSGGGSPQTVGGNTVPPVQIPISTTSGNVAVVTTANSGQTFVATNFAGAGLTGQIANTANNAAISAATSINIATTGLPAFIQAQRMSSMIVTNLQRGYASIP
ncbi:hypothetical protein [Acidocella sp.]|uniref:hypothetical protein n=1 Tax=Acidocella sp. TaxID=50710 RepID=UPI002611F3CE|nr:hypothetical protein [Acidocella sp.]